MLRWLSRIPGPEGRPHTVTESAESSARLLPGLKDWREAPDGWFDLGYTRPPPYLNEVSHLSNRFRHEYMVKLLMGEVRQGKRVFAVGGGSHVVMQGRALRAALKSGRRKLRRRGEPAPNRVRVRRASWPPTSLGGSSIATLRRRGGDNGRLTTSETEVNVNRTSR